MYEDCQAVRVVEHVGYVVDRVVTGARPCHRCMERVLIEASERGIKLLLDAFYAGNVREPHQAAGIAITMVVVLPLLGFARVACRDLMGESGAICARHFVSREDRAERAPAGI